MTTSNYGNKPLSGTFTDDKRVVADQKNKGKKDETRITLSTKEARTILVLIDAFCQSMGGTIEIIKHFEMKGILDQIGNKIKNVLKGEEK